MEHAVWLASIFGPVMTISGIWMLLNGHAVEQMITAQEKNRHMLFLTGILNLLLGFTVFRMYHEWSMHLSVLVTLLGYVLIVRGLLVLFATDWVLSVMHKIAKKHRTKLLSVIPIVWGLGLLSLGYCCS